MLKDPPEAQQRIRDNMDFCALKIDDYLLRHESMTDVSKNSFPMNFVQTMDFFLIHTAR